MPSRKYKCVVSLALLPLLLLPYAQAQQPPRLALRVKKTVRTSVRRSVGFVEPLKCDSQGNLYFRSGAMNILSLPVTKVSPDGEHAATFSLESVPNFKRPEFYDFAIDPVGNVYLLAVTDRSQVAIVAFDADGDYESTITLEILFNPAHVAVFPSGEFLVSGMEMDEEYHLTGKPYLALLDERGTLIKQLTFEGDVQTEPELQGKPEQATAPNQQEPGAQEPDAAEREQPALSSQEFAQAIELGAVATGDDGYLYLMRATPEPQIYVISSSGELVRRLVVPPPEEDAEPLTMKASGGRLVVEFTVEDERGYTKEYIFTMIDPQSGETLSHYVGTYDVAGPFACYTANGFTFIRADRTGQLVIRKTYPY